MDILELLWVVVWPLVRIMRTALCCVNIMVCMNVDPGQPPSLLRPLVIEQ